MSFAKESMNQNDVRVANAVVFKTEITVNLREKSCITNSHWFKMLNKCHRNGSKLR